MSWINDVTDLVSTTVDKAVYGVNAWYDMNIAYNQREADLALAAKQKNDARLLEQYSKTGANTWADSETVKPFLPFDLDKNQTILLAGAAVLIGYAMIRGR